MLEPLKMRNSLAGYAPPFRVGERPSWATRSMFPIRDANDRVLMYAYRQPVAELIVELLNEASR